MYRTILWLWESMCVIAVAKDNPRRLCRNPLGPPLSLGCSERLDLCSGSPYPLADSTRTPVTTKPQAMLLPLSYAYRRKGCSVCSISQSPQPDIHPRSRDRRFAPTIRPAARPGKLSTSAGSNLLDDRLRLHSPTLRRILSGSTSRIL